jgi:hypothetical protein
MKMKKIWCWFVTGLLSLAPTLTAYGDNNPRIITLDGSNQLGTNYDNDFGGGQWKEPLSGNRLWSER